MSFAYKHEPETLHITETSFPSGMPRPSSDIMVRENPPCPVPLRVGKALQRNGAGSEQELFRKERLKLCYMVMQDVNHQLFTESVLDEILLSMRTENKQRRKILQEMDLLPYEDCHPMGLSGGQKQRVAVALRLLPSAL